MASVSTRIADIIVPEIFAPYVINRTAELSALVQSGIITRNPKLDELVTGGGVTINMPFWNDLTGSSQVLNDVDPIETSKITAAADIAALMIRAKGWSSHELAGALAGDDPQMAIADLVANWWNRDEQKTLIQILNGVFASTSMADLVYDGSAATIDSGVILDGKQCLGDAANQLTAVAMHSMAYTKLQKLKLIEYVPNTAANIGPREAVTFPTFLGYRVIVDDGLPVTGTGATAVYTSYLFAPGVIARGEGVPTSLTPVETDRRADMSTDRLFHRRAFVLHPMGVKWAGAATIVGPTPTNAEFATGTNWVRVYEKKQIGIVKITHLV